MTAILRETNASCFDDITLGHYSDQQAGTGLTVLLLGDGRPVGVSVKGGGPASRELELLKPLSEAGRVHAILLAGGSAYGLDAAGGVMRHLEATGIGVAVGPTVVPLVCQAGIFDLHYKSSQVRPTSDHAEWACRDAVAFSKAEKSGSIGVATGATIGKLRGPQFASKTGLGYAAASLGDLVVAALVVVNALGDVIDPASGQIISGLLAEDGKHYHGSNQALYELHLSMQVAMGQRQNTTLAIVLTNADMDKHQLNKVAELAGIGLAKTITPVNTSMDGDTIFAVSSGSVTAHSDVVGTMAAEVLAKAIVTAAEY